MALPKRLNKAPEGLLLFVYSLFLVSFVSFLRDYGRKAILYYFQNIDRGVIFCNLL